jgi:TorA maturation chaperone TorD
MIATWVESARTRQGLYRFLGETLLSPNEERFEVLIPAAQILGQRDLDIYAFSRIWRRVETHFDGAPDIESLEAEYIRLFVAGMSSSLCPPTESFYRVSSGDGNVGEFVAALQREYRAMGLDLRGASEPSDHVATELDVMSFLCGREAEAWEAERTREAADALDIEVRFLQRHMAVWVPVFTERVAAAQPGDFYRDLVDMVYAFVVHDVDYVRAIQHGGYAR